jgi:hypothetical protein
VADGLNLMETDHVAGHAPFTTVLLVAWFALIAAAAWLLICGRNAAPAGATSRADLLLQGWLMLLSMAVPLAFQLACSVLRDTNHSHWPRYFLVHYVFFHLVAGPGLRVSA